jgi:hypothetical protein
MVGSGDILKLRYEFSFDDTQGRPICKTIRRIHIPFRASACTRRRRHRGPTAIKANIGGTEYQYANLYINGGAGAANRAYLVFTGDFWTNGYTALSNGWLELECQLDMDQVGTSQNIDITLFDGSKLLNLLVEDNRPTNHALAKDGAFADTYSHGTSLTPRQCGRHEYPRHYQGQLHNGYHGLCAGQL